MAKAEAKTQKVTKNERMGLGDVIIHMDVTDAETPPNSFTIPVRIVGADCVQYLIGPDRTEKANFEKDWIILDAKYTVRTYNNTVYWELDAPYVVQPTYGMDRKAKERRMGRIPPDRSARSNHGDRDPSIFGFVTTITIRKPGSSHQNTESPY
jgi:hypothetical protein